MTECSSTQKPTGGTIGTRLLHAIAMVSVVGLGLASRRWPGYFPAFLGDSLGDALWALMIFLGWIVLWPQWTITRIAIAALATCWAVEFSQCYHAPWIDAIRATTPGHLVLGQGFLWSDLLAYAAGVGAGVLIETAVHYSGSHEPHDGPA